MQQMYTVTFEPEAQVKDKWNLFNLSPRCRPTTRAGDHRADARGESVHDAGLMAA